MQNLIQIINEMEYLKFRSMPTPQPSVTRFLLTCIFFIMQTTFFNETAEF